MLAASTCVEEFVWARKLISELKLNQLASVRLPESKSDRMVRVRVVSDSYLGMEWEVEDVKIPAQEVVRSMTVEAPVGKPEKPGK